MEKVKLSFLVDHNKIRLFHHEIVHDFIFDNYELVNGTICNQTQVMNTVHHYLRQNRLKKLAGIVIFAESLLQEKVVKQTDLHLDLKGRLYVKANLEQDLHYLAMLEPGLLLQYQILFWRIGIYIESFTTGKI